MTDTAETIHTTNDPKYRPWAELAAKAEVAVNVLRQHYCAANGIWHTRLAGGVAGADLETAIIEAERDGMGLSGITMIQCPYDQAGEANVLGLAMRLICSMPAAYYVNGTIYCAKHARRLVEEKHDAP